MTCDFVVRFVGKYCETQVLSDTIIVGNTTLLVIRLSVVIIRYIRYIFGTNLDC